jgi:superfamily II DNA or RNA helicase
MLEDLRFDGEWRRYQKLALAAFERDRKAGRRRTHIVAPPGSGKTLLGIELARRVGRRALVLAPNSAVQMQWMRAVRSFTDDPRLVATDATGPGWELLCLTYQSLAQLDDPEVALGRLAASRWAAERAAATGQDAEAIDREAAGWGPTHPAAERRRRELARIGASIKREIAQGRHEGVRLADLLAVPARERVRRMAAARVGVVVLDECHHLASLWGYVVRAALAELAPEDDPPHVIGLTATPPTDLGGDESELYDELLGPVDFTIPTPAVVRDGHLAPFQELAWLTEPLDAERAWLADHDTRFRELVTALHDDAEGPLSFPGWVITRVRERRRGPEDDSEVSWESFQRRSPALARAGVRFLASADLRLPDGAPRGEAYRRPPDLEDWLVLLSDYALRCLASSEDHAAASRYEAIAAALRELGFQLTRQGIRRGTSEVDRLLTGSRAKALGLVEVVAAEMEERGDALRGLVLCDAELAPARPDDALTGVLDPAAGTARSAVSALAADLRTAPLRPLLVSGRGLRCAEADADVLLAALKEQAEGRFALPEWDGELDGVLVSLRSTGAEWMPRAWVELATRLLVEGTTGVLVGTRALLGEGWNCPQVNVLVDLGVAATSVSTQQARGRSLRLDPRDPEKLASNWDIVCVAPDLVRGTADYERFVRRHLHLFAPAEDGEIEAGPSHVHPELSPFAPPATERFAIVNRDMLARAGDRGSARERWRIGSAYRAHELRTIVARPRREPDAPEPPEDGAAPMDKLPIDQRVPLGAGAGGALVALLAALATGVPALLAGLLLAPAGAVAATLRLRRSAARLPVVLPLDAAAGSIADAYKTLGELTPEAAASLTIEPRSSGYLRCALSAATPEESERFATALDQLAGVLDRPRYLVSRPLAEPGVGAFSLLGRVLRRRPPFPERLHPVPADLATHKPRAEAFARAFHRRLGPGRLIFTQRSEEGREARAEAAGADGGYETVVRDIWV